MFGDIAACDAVEIEDGNIGAFGVALTEGDDEVALSDQLEKHLVVAVFFRSQPFREALPTGRNARCVLDQTVGDELADRGQVFLLPNLESVRPFVYE